MKVNDLISYRRLRKQLDAGATRVTILGAGLIGCEFAEDLSSAGCRVELVDPSSRPLASLLPEAMSQALQQRLAEKGVVWHLGQTLDRLDHNGACQRATLSSGEAYETDLVISAAGLQPQTALAEKMGLKIDAGIWTDSDMRTSDANVFAIGDCAAVEGRVYSYIEPIHRQAQAIAGAIIGVNHPFQAIAPLVRVKTPSFPLTICPPSASGGDIVAEPNVAADGCRVDYLQDGKLVGFALADQCAANGGELYHSLYS
jgi:rubredoxin-NAD+ reductase